MRNRSLLVEEDVKSFGHKVLGDHHAWRDDPVLLGEVPLAEVLDARG